MQPPPQLQVADVDAHSSKFGYRHAATLVYCCCIFLAGLSVNILGPAGPTITKELKASFTLIGSVFIFEGVGGICGSSSAGHLMSKYRGHHIIGIVCLLLFVLVGGVPQCSNGLQVMGLYMGIGVCLGLLNASCNMMTTWVHHGHNIGPWVNLINSCFGMGASTAPIIFNYASVHVGSGLTAFSGIACFALCPAISALLMRSPTPPPLPPPSPCEQDSLLNGIGVAHKRSSCAGVDFGSRQRYVRWTVQAPLMLVIWLVVGAEISYAAWVCPYATERVGMRATDAGYLNSLYWSSLTLARLCIITPLAACVSAAQLLLPSLCINMLAPLAIMSSPDSATMLFFGTVALGIGVSGLFSNAISILAAYGLLTPSSTSLITASSATGHMIMPKLVGLIIEHTSYDAFMIFMFCANASGFAALCAVVLHLNQNFTSVKSRVAVKEQRRADVELSEPV